MKEAKKGKILGIVVIVMAGLLSIISSIVYMHRNNSTLEIIHTASIGISGKSVGKDTKKRVLVRKGAKIHFILMGDNITFKIKEINKDHLVIVSNYELYDINKKNNLKEYKVYKEKKYQVEYLVPDNSSSFIFYWSSI